MNNSDDIEFMRAALAVARQGLGRTAPNPAVGCVLVKKGAVIAMARTADGGRPHAEVEALRIAGVNAKGATAYVTLEPCSHHGQTGPCAEALVKAGVARVVIGCGDPDPRVSGGGVKILREAGIEVSEGIMEKECREANKGFILKVTENRPMVTLKVAVTADGMIAPAKDERLWITGDLARKHVHLERSKNDAILVGIGTVLADDPDLTTRLEGVTHKVPRIILDSNLKIPLSSKLVTSAKDVPVWVFHNGNSEAKNELEKRGVKLFTGTSVDNTILKLAEMGITRLFVEGGAAVLKSFAEAGICDEFLLYRAPGKSFPGGKSAGFEDMQGKLGLKLRETRVLGEDLLEIYRP